MRKKGYCVSGDVRDEVGEKFQKDGLECDVKRLKDLFATEDSLSRMVCKIVKNSSNMHKELKDLQLEFKSTMVKSILERLCDFPTKALLFFRWVDEFGSFRHDEKTYNALAKILGTETSRGSFQEIFREMKSAGYKLEMLTYERFFYFFCLVNMTEEAVQLFEVAMAGSNKPLISDFHELLRKIVTSEKPDMDLFSRVLKAYSGNGYVLSFKTQKFVLACLKQVGERHQSMEAMNKGLKNMLDWRKPKVKRLHGQSKISEDKNESVFERFGINDERDIDIVDAKAAGIKGSMIPTSCWILLRALEWKGQFYIVLFAYIFSLITVLMLFIGL